MPKKTGSAYSYILKAVQDGAYEGAVIKASETTRNKDGSYSYNFLVGETKVSFVSKDETKFSVFVDVAKDKKGPLLWGKLDLRKEEVYLDIAKAEGIKARRVGDIQAEPQQAQPQPTPPPTPQPQEISSKNIYNMSDAEKQAAFAAEHARIQKIIDETVQGQKEGRYPPPIKEEPGVKELLTSAYNSAYKYIFGEEKKPAPKRVYEAPDAETQARIVAEQARIQSIIDATANGKRQGKYPPPIPRDTVETGAIYQSPDADSEQVPEVKDSGFFDRIFGSVFSEPTYADSEKLSLFKKAATDAGVNCRDLVGLIQHESRCNNDCGKTHIGYGQFTTTTFNSVVKDFKLKEKYPDITDWSPTNPEANAYAAAYHYKQNLSLVGDDKVKAYVIHNLGHGEGMRFLKQLEKNPDGVIDTKQVKWVDSNPKNYMHNGEFFTYKEAYNNMAQILEAASQRVEKKVGSIAENSQKTPESLAKDNIAVVMNLQNAINNPSAPEATLPATNKNQKQI